MLALRPIQLRFLSPVDATWAERTEGSEIDDVNFGAWARSYSTNGGGFTWMAMESDCESDIGSPPLWKNSGSPVNPDETNRANAQYQREMLDMVREVSESHYELSMKDLVELSRGKGASPLYERELPRIQVGRGKGARKSSSRVERKVSGGESMDRMPFLLKMVSPFPIWRGRSSSTRNTSPNGSPKSDIRHKRRILDRLRTLLFGKNYSSPYFSKK